MTFPTEIELSVVLPSYLEEENLRLILPRLKTALDAERISHEIIVVDTEAPMDQTASVCAANGARYINRVGGNLYGDAVRSAIDSVQGQYAVFMDADGSHPPEFIPQLLRERAAYDVVIASRYVEGGYTENSYLLVLMSRILNITYSFVLNLKCHDVSNSFKLYRSSFLKELQLVCDHFDVVEEILFKLQRKQRSLRIKEIPFTFKKRMFGETKRSLLVFISTYFLTMIKLWLSDSSFGLRFWKHTKAAKRKK